MQAGADAAGCVLLAHREVWRSSLMRIEPTLGLDDEAAEGIVERGYAEWPGGCDGYRSLAVAVPQDALPIAALAVHAPSALTDSSKTVVAILQRAATRMAIETQQPQAVHGICPSTHRNAAGGPSARVPDRVRRETSQ
jgi:hypothetical protein